MCDISSLLRDGLGDLSSSLPVKELAYVDQRNLARRTFIDAPLDGERPAPVAKYPACTYGAIHRWVRQLDLLDSPIFSLARSCP
jgi:hypothetical protein